MKSLIFIILSIFAFVCASCSTKANSIIPIESIEDFFSGEEEKDLESKFIGKETQSKVNENSFWA